MTGAEFRAARERRGIDRSVLAELLGGFYSDRDIREWENSGPPPVMEEAIREALGMQNMKSRHHPPVRTPSGVRFGW